MKLLSFQSLEVSNSSLTVPTYHIKSGIVKGNAPVVRHAIELENVLG